MAYTLFSKDSMKIIIYDDRSRNEYSFPIGDLLFSFLELDLFEYNRLYLSLRDDVLYADYNNLIEKYPLTAKNHYLKPVKENDDYSEEELRDSCDVFLMDNNDDFSEINKHPYFSFIDTLGFGLTQRYQELDLYGYQQALIELIEYCLLEHNNPKINNLTLSEKYYLFTISKTEQYKYKIDLHMSPLLFPYNTNLRDLAKAGLLDIENPNDDILAQIKGKSKAVIVNTCNTVHDFLFFELYCLFKYNLIVKRCQNCGKYFIVKGGYATDCCDRIPPGEKYTCKRLMTMKKRKQKITNNPIIREYEKAYKRYYARVTNKKLSNEDFRLWTEEASKKREEAAARYAASPSEDIIKEFKEYLGNR
ncbi:DUF6076 domain-containing protein [Lactonifactor longoviformis]|uniref:DUF6076 domain-containing protein n=1 Tax=Lactonifactor longoviformis TaxID=341220 RepID=UPI00210A5352|nr:DUF6076 domain-containing protein [Lactonifactor longoviformis]MCQ4672440.1 DUF6076 domain-containing protein [Lactonifactor longoviformis]